MPIRATKPSFEQFIRMWFGWSPGRKLMCVINGYIDTSSDQQGDERVTTVAGYVGDDEEWARVEALWVEQLGETNHSSFHASDFKSHFPDWKTEVRPFAKLLADSKLFPICAAIYQHDWQQLDPASEYGRLFRRPEHACLDVFCHALEQACWRLYGDEPIGLLFDADFGARKWGQDVFDKWESVNECRPYFRPTFLNARDKMILKKDPVRPLECADLAAYVCRGDGIVKGMLRLDMSSVSLDDVDPSLTCAIDGGANVIWTPSRAAEIEEAIKSAREDGRLEEPPS
jgi:hypothetical protein